jgi:phage terminase large subunit-like protein
MDEKERLKLQLERLALLEKKVELQEGLPFIHGWKWYPWAREFFDSTNKLNFLCAANQISKSSTQIRKCIDWATNRKKWPTLWRHRPMQFWYLYPTATQASTEFETKWQQFLPQGRYKTDAVIDGKENPYAWKEVIKNKEIFCIHFFVVNVRVYFKSYSQDVQALQTGTCDAIFCDEELPEDLYSELIFRISASDGYFHMVFTATLGQEFWRCVIEEHGDKEKLKGAGKWQVSMYDCQFYEDGSPSHWTKEKIEQAIARCKSHAEVLRRVFGRFVVDEGLKYPAFDIKRHMVKPFPIPKDWHIYGAADIGSGGEKGHPAACVFVAVRPDFRAGAVFRGWRGDQIETTAGDVLVKFRELRGESKLAMQIYDAAAKDFGTIAQRAGEGFLPADKNHERGEQVVNSLFKNDMLVIFDDPELGKLAGELVQLRKDTPKNKAKDDFADALRYAVMAPGWDWSFIVGAKPADWVPPTKKLTPQEQEIQERRHGIGPHGERAEYMYG